MVDNEIYLTEEEHSEKMLLAKVLIYPDERDLLRLESKHFLDARHGAIYDKILNDRTFTKELLLNDSLTKPQLYGNFTFVRTITDFPIATKHGVTGDQMRVYEMYKRREENKVMKEYLSNPSDESAMKVQKRIKELNDFNFHTQDKKLEMLAEIHEDLFSDKGVKFYPTGFKELDKLIDGFEPQQLNVIAARSSMGKTAFALQLGDNLQKIDDAEVVFCSIESTEKNMTHRLLSSIAMVDLRKFKDPYNRMTDDDIEKVMLASDTYYKADFRIEEHIRLTPNKIRQIANTIPHDKTGFIIIDYLQLMESDERISGDYDRISDVSRELKIITQEFPNIVLIPLAQVNRGTESREDKRPMMSDIRNTGNIEQDASMIMMLYRDDYYNPTDELDPNAPSVLEVIVRKNKDGGLGTAELGFYKSIQKIY